MAELNFEPTQEHRESGGFEPVPNGTYEAQMVNSEWHNTKKNDGQYLKVELEILGPQYVGRKIFENLHLNNNSPQAVEIAEHALTQICDALGKPRVNDSEELHYQPMMIDVVIKPSSNPQYGPDNSIRAYRAKGNGQRPQAGKSAVRPAAKKRPPAQASNKKQPVQDPPPWAQQAG